MHNNINDTTENIKLEDIKSEIKAALDSERLLTARMVDSVLRTSQMASMATPEMQDMFQHWLSLVSDQLLREISESESKDKVCDIHELSCLIGVSEATIFSLLAYLHRTGKICVNKIYFSKGNGKNLDACPCLT